jgi:flagellar protein FlaG
MSDPINAAAPRTAAPSDFVAVKVDAEKPQPKAAPKSSGKAAEEAASNAAALRQAVELLNQQLVKSNQVLGFSYDESVKSPVITVKNSESGEVVRQIPNEDVLRIAHSIDQMKGIMFNKMG